MHFLDFETIIENELREVILDAFPLSWREDVISYNFTDRLRRRFHSVTLIGTHYPLVMELEVYKLSGKPETKHGDIGLLIRSKLATGELIEGAGFLEAKLRARNSSRFLQVRKKQCEKLLRESPHTQLLLYDYRPVAVLDDPRECFDSEFFPFAQHGTSMVTHGPVLPLNLAVAINHFDDRLYQYSYPIAHQISRRYLHLHDLDFSAPAIAAVKGFPTTIDSPSIVLVFRTATRAENLPEAFRPNNTRYRLFG